MQKLLPILLLLLSSCASTPPQPPPKAMVHIFLLKDCPISNAYAPEIARLMAEFPDIPFQLVYEDQDISVESLHQHAREFNLTAPLVHDSQHALAHQLHVPTVPTAVLIQPGGQIAYKGRIDDRFTALAQPQREPQSRDLRNALIALSQGRPIPVAQTKAIGCTIN